MRFYALLVLVLLSLSNGTAQNTEVAKKGAPDESGIAILHPDPVDVERASGNNLKVFKILPRGMFDYENNAYGLRGGGAYYSFTNSSHSYNRVPQLGLDKGSLLSGFYGANYGLMINIGKVDLSSIDSRTPEVASLETHKPFKHYVDVYDKEKRAAKFILDGRKYNSYLPAVVGDTYILRAISYDEADSLVAFRIDRIDDNGTAVVWWKLIKEFTPTPLLRYTDAEVSEKVAAILKSPAYEGVTFTVVDNLVALGGTIDPGNTSSLMKELNGAGITKISMSIGARRASSSTK